MLNPAGQPPPATSAYVSFSAEINPNTTESLIAQMSHLANNGVQEVTLLMSTPGGSVMHGLNLYNVWRAMPFKLITHNVGNVDSIGNAIFLAGEERYCCPQSSFMFHGVAMNGQGPMNANALQEKLDGLLSDERRISEVIAQRTSLSAEDIESMFLQGQTKDAAYAVSAGIVHEVRDVQIPPGVPTFALVFQR